MKTNWIGLSQESLNGALVVLNLDRDSKLPSDYIEQVSEHISSAYSKGLFVAYVFDSSIGISETPDEFEKMDESSGSFLSASFGVKYLDFELDPEHMKSAFRQMAMKMKEDVPCLNHGVDFNFIGKVKLGGDAVLIPLAQITLK